MTTLIFGDQESIQLRDKACLRAEYCNPRAKRNLDGDDTPFYADKDAARPFWVSRSGNYVRLHLNRESMLRFQRIRRKVGLTLRREVFYNTYKLAEYYTAADKLASPDKEFLLDLAKLFEAELQRPQERLK